MSQNRRKYARRDVDCMCWIGAADVLQLVEGNVRNISEGGAKVVCHAQIDLPETVDLYLTRDGRVGRRCKVVWRSDDALGLMFLEKASFAPPDSRVEI